MSGPRKIVDAKLLARLAGLRVRPGQMVEGGLTGMHKSPHHGQSVEFAQHREYSPGDELKHIDWRAYAKSDRHYVKQFEDETNLRTWLLLDTSGSMDYGAGGRPTKLVYSARMTAAIAWLLLGQGDAVGLLTFGERIGRYVPPRARHDHFWHLARLLEDEPVGGPTNAVGALQYLAEIASRRGLVVLISDCMDFDGRLAAVARQLQRRRHRVVVIHVLDDDELEFPFHELTLFEDMESEATELADPRGMRDQYLEEIRVWSEGLRRELLDGGVSYHRVTTSAPLERALFEVLGVSR